MPDFPSVQSEAAFFPEQLSQKELQRLHSQGATSIEIQTLGVSYISAIVSLLSQPNTLRLKCVCYKIEREGKHGVCRGPG